MVPQAVRPAVTTACSTTGTMNAACVAAYTSTHKHTHYTIATVIDKSAAVVHTTH